MHRRVPTSLLVALIVALGGASLATAQGGPAALGTPVTIVDPEGIIRGEVTVREIVDPFTEHEPSAPPPEGMRYVLLVVTFQAALDQQLDAQPYQVVLQDTDGYLYSTQFIPRPEDAVLPDLQGQLMAPDNRISGAITYHVPADATIDRIVYQPSFDRFVELADLTPGTGPALGDATTYTDALGASVTVSTQLIDPFTAIDPAYPPAEGMRFVVAHPVFENSGELPFYADPYDVVLRDTGGQLYNITTVYQPEGFTVPPLEAQTMSPGDRISGYLGFQVPVDAQLADLMYFPESSRLVTLADLDGGGVSTPPAGSPAPAATPAPAASPAPVASPAPAASVPPEASAGTGR
jgi:hypothetical protein